MKTSILKKIILLSTFVLCVQSMGLHADGVTQVLKNVGKAGVYALRAGLSGASHVIRSKAGLYALACLGCYGGGRFLWNRCRMFPKIRYALNPPVGESGWQGGRKIYNWRIGEPNFACSAGLLANEGRVKQQFRHDCTASSYTILSSADLKPIPIGKVVSWNDLFATARAELKQLEGWLSLLRSCACFSLPYWNPWGAEHDYQQLCRGRNVVRRDQEEHIAVADANRIHLGMQAKNFTTEDRIISYLLLKPNYTAAYQLYWEVYRRCERLRTLSDIFERAAKAKHAKPVISSGDRRPDGAPHVHVDVRDRRH